MNPVDEKKAPVKKKDQSLTHTKHFWSPHLYIAFRQHGIGHFDETSQIGAKQIINM